jgi:hypothetical protein
MTESVAGFTSEHKDILLQVSEAPPQHWMVCCDVQAAVASYFLPDELILMMEMVVANIRGNG